MTTMLHWSYNFQLKGWQRRIGQASAVVWEDGYGFWSSRVHVAHNVHSVSNHLTFQDAESWCLAHANPQPEAALPANATGQKREPITPKMAERPRQTAMSVVPATSDSVGRETNGSSNGTYAVRIKPIRLAGKLPFQVNGLFSPSSILNHLNGLTVWNDIDVARSILLERR